MLLKGFARSKRLGTFAALKAVIVPQLVHFCATAVGHTALAAKAHLSLGVCLAIGAKRQTSHVKVGRLVFKRLLAASVAAPMLLVKLAAASRHIGVRDGCVARLAQLVFLFKIVTRAYLGGGKSIQKEPSSQIV